MSNKSGIGDNVVSLPQGGGAISGMGEKFSPDLFTGTGNFSVPIAIPEGRNGFQPQLSLGYSTGNGNGAFGLGWGLSVPGIMRKTNKGVPKYNDENDVYILSGSEDLIPVSESEAKETEVVTAELNLVTVTRTKIYRPRTEGLFARISHINIRKDHFDNNNTWISRISEFDYWEVRSKDGLVSYYGNPDLDILDVAGTIIANPDDREKIFAWKLYKTEDPFKNEIRYEYLRDYLAKDDSKQQMGHDQLYLKKIGYVDYLDSGTERFLISVNFDYGSEDRSDPFSTYTSGFQVRTNKLCKEIKINTHPLVAHLPNTYDDQTYNIDEGILTKSYILEYENSPYNGASLLKSVQVRGHDQDANENPLTEDMPPLTFDYTGYTPENRSFSPVRGKDLPAQGLASPTMELIDLDGNGLPDIIEMNGVSVRYWQNMGDGEFGVPRLMDEAPLGLSLEDPDVQLVDADGDGRADLLSKKPGLTGYFPLNFSGKWDRESFRPQEIAPSFSFADPEVKMMDLTGNGITDVLRNGVSLECYFQDSELGWDEPRIVSRSQAFDFPNITFGDPRVKTADMSGDGLQDLVLVENGGVSYWPNLGHGNWGARKTMSFYPRRGYDFNPERIYLGDLDGDGVADMIYVDNHKISLWINHQGERFGDVIEISGTPPVSDMDSVRIVDLLGQGTPGILWSSDGSYGGRNRMYFLDLTGGVKPYVLTEMDNNMGAVTRVKYESSTVHYLRDYKIPSERWQTHLPFPVQVVSCVEVIDQISQGKLATEYRYHHGHWDGGEREFRGFGRVDQQDTETFERYNSEGLHGAEQFESVSQTSFSPPLLTKSWFYLGPVGMEYGDWYIPDFSGEYFSEDINAFNLQEDLKSFLSDLPRRARRDAHRALRGSSLRTELYALDGDPRQDRPYTVTENHYDLREEYKPSEYVGGQFPEKKNWGSAYVFFSMGAASRTTQWERGEESENHHTFSFSRNYDSYGNLKESISVAVPRGGDYMTPIASPEPYLVTMKEKVFGYNDTAGGTYIVDRVCSDKDYEISNDGSMSLSELIDTTVYNTNNQKAIAHVVYNYDGNGLDDLDGGGFGEIKEYGVLKYIRRLVISNDVINDVYGSTPLIYDITNSEWGTNYPEEALDFLNMLDLSGGPEGFVGGWYVQESRRKISGRGQVTRDWLGWSYWQRYDYDAYQYKPRLDAKTQRSVRGFIGNTNIQSSMTMNFRTLQYEYIRDPNRNYTKVLFSPLGFVTAKLFANKSSYRDTNADPAVKMEYDFFNFIDNGDPVYVKSTTREWHKNDSADPNFNNNTFVKYEYSDGFGRLVQTRQQAEDVIFGDTADDRVFGDSGLNPDPDGTSTNAKGTERDSQDPLNVVVSGWQVYDNKGQVVEKYEPYFDSGFDFQAPTETQKGKKVEMSYDPRGQVIKTVNPDGSMQQVIFGVPGALNTPNVFEPTPWESYTYDANDLAGTTHATESAAYDDHWNTPSSVELDALGRQVKTIQRVDDNSANDIIMKYEYDIRGNVLKITDALDRTLTTNKYSEANWLIEEDHLDSGKTTYYFHYSGKPKHIVRANGSETMIFFDSLVRQVYVWGKDQAADDWTVREFTYYGEHAFTGTAQYDDNHRGRPYQIFDGAGLITFEEYDYKGNVVDTKRQVVKDQKLKDSIPTNWQGLKDVGFFADHTALIPDDFGTTGYVKPDPTELSAHVTDYVQGLYIHKYAYDALSRVVETTLPQGTGNTLSIKQKFKYNERGLVSYLESYDATYSHADLHYNAKGQRILMVMDKVMTRYAYDENTFRLKRMRAWVYEKPVGTTHEYAELNSSNWHDKTDYSYTHDLVGNILSLRDKSPDDFTRTYQYDPLYRLIEAVGRECDAPLSTPPWLTASRCDNLTNTRTYKREYSYDEMGNIEELKHIDVSHGTNSFTRRYLYQTGNDLLDKFDDGNNPATVHATYTYDANGNQIKTNTERNFTWNHQNQMITYFNQTSDGTEPTVYSIYLYDYMGQRVKKWVRKDNDLIQVTNYLSIDHEHLYETDHALSLDTANDVDFIKLNLGSEMIASENFGTDTKKRTGQYRWLSYINDHLGSPVLVYRTNTGYDYSSNEYFPFGELAFGTASNFSQQRYRFGGKERDEDHGLSYFGARYYAPWTCRFTSVDPLWNKAPSECPYCYAGNNPLRYVDPTGMEKTESGNSGAKGASGGNPFSGSQKTDGDVDIGMREVIHGLAETFSQAKEAIGNAISDVFGGDSKGSSVGDLKTDNLEVTPIKDVIGQNPLEDSAMKKIPETWDPITNERISKLDDRVQEPAANFINKVESELGIQLRVTDGYRSIGEQNELYQQGRTKPGSKVTNAKGGESYHNYGLAIDVVPMENGQPNWDSISNEIGDIGKGFGFEWGGDWTTKDLPHFQMTFGQSIESLKSR